MAADVEHWWCEHWCGVEECFADCGELVCDVRNEDGSGCRDYPGDDRPLTRYATVRG